MNSNATDLARRLHFGWINVAISMAIGMAANQIVFADANQPTNPELQPRPQVIKAAHTVVDERFRDDVITVKFKDGLTVRLRDGALSDLGTGALDQAAMDVLESVAMGVWERSYSINEDTLGEFRDKAQAKLDRVVADLNLQYNFFLPADSNIEAVIDALNALDCVEIALPIPVPVQAPLPGDLEPSQLHLDPATAGVDAEYMWTIAGGDGGSVQIVDLEYSWNFNHQDISPATLLGPQPNDPFNDTNHGTAVMGILGAIRNGWGTTGIANQATLYTAATNTGAGSGVWDVGAAVITALGTLGPGDIILIEQQMFGPNTPACCFNNTCVPGTNCQFGNVAVEWWLPWYNAIVTAVGNGIIVVEAAGNGAQDLDNAVYSMANGGHWPFLPANDSGAILVGAGAFPGGSDVDRSRLWFSNYGSTVDLQGHGELVLTTGYGDYWNEGPNLLYTWSFAGTSSGSAIVTGACAIVQSAFNALTGGVLTPAQLLSAMQTTGSPQQAGTFPASQNIGPRPDAGAGLCSALAPLDCNNNGVADGTDISNGTSQDCNANCYPDDCEPDCNANNSADDCDMYTSSLEYGNTGINPGSWASSTIAVGDFDGDTDLDVVMGLPQESGTPILMLENNGSGTFTQVLQYDLTFWGFLQFAVGDIDNDNDLDLVTIEDTSPEQFQVLLNDGTGTFTRGFGNGLFGPDVRQLELAHLDGDANLDLVMMVYNTEKISIYPGNGDGTFALTATDYFFSFGASPSEMAVADLDGDGDRDIVVGLKHGGGQDGSVDVFFNQGDGTYQGPTNYLTTSSPVTSIDVADVDTDGDLDLVLRTAYQQGGGSWASNVEIMLNDGSGAFAAPIPYSAQSLPVTNLYSAPVRALDVDGDGTVDLAATGPLGSIAIFVNDGTGVFTRDFSVDYLPFDPSGARILEVGDFNGDGATDMVSVADSANVINILLSQTQFPTEMDCNANAQVDSCDIAGGGSSDCQSDGIPDECQLAGNDCNGNGTPDDCEMTDCNGNGIIDSCDIASGASADDDGNGIPDDCSTTTAPPPSASSGGSKALTVTPSTSGASGSVNGFAGGGLPAALLVTADVFPCMSLYVQGDGSLGSDPVFQTPNEWGTVVVTGEDIVPETTYSVQADVGSPGNPILSEPTLATTWLWGDIDNNEVVNLADVFFIVQGFQGDFDNAPLHTVDIWPCTPNGVVNLDDVFRDVLIFQGQSYEEGGCSLPCSGGAASAFQPVDIDGGGPRHRAPKIGIKPL